VGTVTAKECSEVDEVMLVGAWVKRLLSFPFAELEGLSRPRIMATLYVAEVLPYLSVLWLWLHLPGIARGSGGMVVADHRRTPSALLGGGLFLPSIY